MYIRQNTYHYLFLISLPVQYISEILILSRHVTHVHRRRKSDKVQSSFWPVNISYPCFQYPLQWRIHGGAPHFWPGNKSWQPPDALIQITAFRWQVRTQGLCGSVAIYLHQLANALYGVDIAVHLVTGTAWESQNDALTGWCMHLLSAVVCALYVSVQPTSGPKIGIWHAVHWLEFAATDTDTSSLLLSSSYL